MRHPRFFVGLLIGGLFGLLIWYWQKSTSAEDGALDLLDRLAISEARTKDLQSRLGRVPDSIAARQAPAPSPTLNDKKTQPAKATADNLQAISGIGPTYARRLQEAGITTFGALAALAPTRLMAISGARSEEAVADWIKQAHERLAG
ncbi:MAG: helix-hairpin-helix domain-containing protein [Candidatus Promineifilaceae bacterium]